jgi:hypothetical protein
MSYSIFPLTLLATCLSPFDVHPLYQAITWYCFSGSALGPLFSLKLSFWVTSTSPTHILITPIINNSQIYITDLTCFIVSSLFCMIPFPDCAYDSSPPWTNSLLSLRGWDCAVCSVSWAQALEVILDTPFSLILHLQFIIVILIFLPKYSSDPFTFPYVHFHHSCQSYHHLQLRILSYQISLYAFSSS